MVGRDQVVVISDSLWRRRFGADPGIISRAVLLNGHHYTVVGVAPRGFTGTDNGIVAEFWAPLAMAEQLVPDITQDQPRTRRNDSWLSMIARLKPGVSTAQAATAMNVVKKRINATYHRTGQYYERPVTVARAGGLIGGSETQAGGLIAVLMVVVGFVLLVACANVANLLLARATGRQREIAIRQAVGARRWRAGPSNADGEHSAGAFRRRRGRGVRGHRGARHLSRGGSFAGSNPLSLRRGPERFWPARRASLFSPASSLGWRRPCAPPVRTWWWRSRTTRRCGAVSADSGCGTLLVTVQVALSLVLLAGAGLFLRSLRNASSIDIGMNPRNILLLAVDPKLHNYSPEKTRQFLSQLRDRVSALPGVQSVSFVDSLPLSIGGTNDGFHSPGKKTKDDDEVNANVYRVGAGFFESLGIPLLRGRDFNLQSDDEHVAVINQSMARHMFGDEDPLGRQIVQAGVQYTVVGIARDSKSRKLDEEPTNCAYLSLEGAPQKVMSFYGISMAVKTSVSPRSLLRPVRQQVADLDPTMAVFNAATMQEHVDQSLLVPRICAALLAVFGAVGLTLAT